MNFNSKLLITSAKLPQHHSSNFQNLGLVIEWPKGSVRVGKNKDGKPWKTKMEADYGYVPDTTAAGDKENLDVYVGPDAESDKVYVVEQLKEDGEFDEYKCLLGFPDLDTAYETYLKHYPDGWDDDRVGGVFEVPWDYAFEKIEEHQAKTAALPTLPKYLYHGTVRKHLKNILTHGLKVSKSQSHNEWPGAVYLALDAGDAAMYPDHYEDGEKESGGVVLRVNISQLNESALRPDDADFPDMFANLTDKEIVELKDEFGDDFDEDSWAYCEWPVSLHLTGQVAYIEDIPPQAISVMT